jgi:hypothetical protein
MILEEHELEKMDIAAKVANSLRLSEIRLHSINVDNNLDKFNLEKEFLVSVEREQATYNFSPNEQKLVVSIGTGVSFYVGKMEDPIEDRELAVQIKVKYKITYNTPPGDAPDEFLDHGFDAFSNITSLSACWPYLRHQVNCISTDIGLPFTMPLLVVKVKEQSDKQVKKSVTKKKRKTTKRKKKS